MIKALTSDTSGIITAWHTIQRPFTRKTATNPHKIFLMTRCEITLTLAAHTLVQ